MKDNLTASSQQVGSRLSANKSSLDSNFGAQNTLNNSASTAQLKSDATGMINGQINTKPVNNTGLPDNIKTGMERLSGYSMDDVKVHYNSSKPAQLKARAYAQGNNIHLGPGQEQHLPHEAWHVVQQKQGRVKPTLEGSGGVMINDSAALEKEADQMGSKAANFTSHDHPTAVPTKSGSSSGEVVQRLVFTIGKDDIDDHTRMPIDTYITSAKALIENESPNQQSLIIPDKFGDPYARKRSDRRKATREHGPRKSYKPPRGQKPIAGIGINEDLKIVAHGSKNLHKVGGYSPTKLARLFKNLGLPEQYSGTITIYGCYAGGRFNNRNSFIQDFLNALNNLGYKDNALDVLGMRNVAVDNQYELDDDHYKTFDRIGKGMVPGGNLFDHGGNARKAHNYRDEHKTPIIWLSARQQNRDNS